MLLCEFLGYWLRCTLKTSSHYYITENHFGWLNFHHNNPYPFMQYKYIVCIQTYVKETKTFTNFLNTNRSVREQKRNFLFRIILLSSSFAFDKMFAPKNSWFRIVQCNDVYVGCSKVAKLLQMLNRVNKFNNNVSFSPIFKVSICV